MYRAKRSYGLLSSLKTFSPLPCEHHIAPRDFSESSGGVALPGWTRTIEMKGSGRPAPCSCGRGGSGRRRVRIRPSMRFAASRLPSRLASFGSSEAVIASSTLSTLEQLQLQGARGRAGGEVGEISRGAGTRADALSSEVAFEASAAPHSRKRAHGLIVTPLGNR